MVKNKSTVNRCHRALNGGLLGPSSLASDFCLSQPFSKSFILSCGSVYVPSDLVYFGFLILPMYFSSIMPALSFSFSTKAPWLLKSYPERVYLSKKSKVSISLYLPSWLPRQESRLRRERTQPHASTQDANHVISNS